MPISLPVSMSIPSVAELFVSSYAVIALRGIEPLTSGSKGPRPSPAETPGLHSAAANGVDDSRDPANLHPLSVDRTTGSQIVV